MRRKTANKLVLITALFLLIFFCYSIFVDNAVLIIISIAAVIVWALSFMFLKVIE